MGEIIIRLIMEKYYRNKYRIPSTRLRFWDYSKQAIYFITICTKGRECFFGNIINAKMQYSEIGKHAYSEWFKTLELRPDMNLQLGEFCVMPNHIHGIIIIGENEYNINPCRDAMPGVSVKCENENNCRDAMPGVSEQCENGNCRDAMPGVSVQCENGFDKRDAKHGVSTVSKFEIKPHNCVKNIGIIAKTSDFKKYQNKFAPQTKNISSIIRGYKSAVTKAAKRYDCNFEWQERFYDCIIKSYREYQVISDYIIDNHQNWENDSLMV